MRNVTSYKKNDGLRLLKFFIYLMGMALMCGALFVTYTIYKRHYIFDRSEQSNEKLFDVGKHQCNQGNIELDAESDVVQIVYDSNDRIFLLTKPQNNKQFVIIVDYCSGQVLTKIKVQLPSLPSYKRKYDHSNVQDITNIPQLQNAPAPHTE